MSGRRLSELPVREEIVALRLAVLPKAYRRRIRRRRYRPTCECAQVLPGIVAAPAPGRLIERGKWGVSLWVEALLDKFLYGRASERWIGQLCDLGVPLSAGTLSGGLRTIAPLFGPVYQALRPRLGEEGHWHVARQSA